VDATIRNVGGVAGETLHVSLQRIEFRTQRAEPFVYILRAIPFLVISHLSFPFVVVIRSKKMRRD
jgi:hypothetical protein